jgi:shikimate dehydrogenase
MAEPFHQQISARTRYCAVYGHPIQHSASPAMQNAGIAALGLDWRYLAFDVHPDNLEGAIRGAMAMQFLGLNLTVPHKILALEMVDALDESAKTWGAVNTVRFEARRSGSPEWQPLRNVEPADVTALRSCGFNTDADAIVRSLDEDLGMKLIGRSVVLLGAGGAGRVAALKLAASGVKHLFLVNRTMAKAEEIRHEIRNRFPEVNVELGYPAGNIDLLLNSTSLGLRPDDPLPFNQKEFSVEQAEFIYDMVYRPAETALLKVARQAGRQAANGLGMLLYQGAAALEIWSGCRAPIPIMREALELCIYGGTGKTGKARL